MLAPRHSLNAFSEPRHSWTGGRQHELDAYFTKLLNLTYAIKQGSRAQADFDALGRGLQLINADGIRLIASWIAKLNSA